MIVLGNRIRKRRKCRVWEGLRVDWRMLFIIRLLRRNRRVGKVVLFKLVIQLMMVMIMMNRFDSVRITNKKLKSNVKDQHKDYSRKVMMTLKNEQNKTISLRMTSRYHFLQMLIRKMSPKKPKIARDSQLFSVIIIHLLWLIIARIKRMVMTVILILN